MVLLAQISPKVDYDSLDKRLQPRYHSSTCRIELIGLAVGQDTRVFLSQCTHHRQSSSFRKLEQSYKLLDDWETTSLAIGDHRDTNIQELAQFLGCLWAS